jgi:hypothetical protein
MARDLSTLATTLAIRTSATYCHVREYAPGYHADLPNGGRVSEFHFPEVKNDQDVVLEVAEKVVFIERNGASTLRRTSQMWFEP